MCVDAIPGIATWPLPPAATLRRPRRRARRRLVRLAARSRPASCSCRSSPSATATTSSPPRAAAGAAAYLTLAPDRPATARRSSSPTPLRRADGARPRGRARRSARRRTRGRHHRLGRQDEHQGPRRGRARRRPARRGPTSAASTTTRACRSTILDAPDDTEVLVLEMGMRGFGEIARLCAIGRPDDRRRHPRRRRRTPSASAASTASPGPRASWSRRCPPTAPRSSTPTTTGCAAMARAHRGRACCSFGDDADCDVRIHDLVLDELARPSFHVAHAVGSRRGRASPSAARTWRSTPPRRSPCAGVVGVDLGAAVDALADARAVADADGRPPAGRRRPCSINDATTPTRRRCAPRSTRSRRSPAARRVAVLGVMAELAEPVADHAAIAAHAADARHRADRRRHRPLRRRARSTIRRRRSVDSSRRRRRPRQGQSRVGSRLRPPRRGALVELRRRPSSTEQ